MATTVRAGKFDTTSVNGPHDDDVGWDLRWDAVSWYSVEDDVRRLRQRIFKASQAGDLKRVRNLQKLMLRSRSNTLHSVRRVTQHNADRKTPGVDGQVALTSLDRAEVTVSVHRHTRSWQARPVKRVFIPKANGKQRPLGIPTDLANRGVSQVESGSGILPDRHPPVPPAGRSAAAGAVRAPLQGHRAGFLL